MRWFDGITGSMDMSLSEFQEAVTDFTFLGSQITADDDYSMKLKGVCSLEEKL